MLAFPGVFRGLLDAHSRSITVDMLIAAARALAAVVTDDELNASYIVPSVFHPDVSIAVAAAVRKAVRVTDQAIDPADDAASADLGRRRSGSSASSPRGTGARLAGGLCAAVVVNLVVLYWPGAGVGRRRSPASTRSCTSRSSRSSRWPGCGRVPPAWLVRGCSPCHAVVSELVQHWLLADRSGDPRDVVADLVGVALGVSSPEAARNGVASTRSGGSLSA